MVTERVQMTENKEMPSEAFRLWIGGFFDIGGMMTFAPYITKTDKAVYTYVHPILQVGDNNSTHIKRFHELVGLRGRVIPVKNSLIWRAEINAAREIIDMMDEDYSPSRRSFFDALDLIDSAEEVEEKIAIMRLYQEEPRFQEQLDERPYARPVTNLDFMAGAIDNRCIEGIRKTKWGPRPDLLILTKNYHLLLALSRHLGVAEPRVLAPSGKVKDIDGSLFIQKESTAVLQLRHTAILRDYLLQIQPHLRLRGEEIA